MATRKSTARLVLGLVVMLFPAIGARAQSPWQLTGSGSGLPQSSGASSASYGGAHESTANTCPNFGGPVLCDPSWTFDLNSITYNGSITDGVSEVYYCAQSFHFTNDQIDVCFHAIAYKCQRLLGCGGIVWHQEYWQTDVEVVHVDIAGNIGTVLTYLMGPTNYQVNGSTIPFRGFIKLHNDRTGHFGGPYCDTFSVFGAYSSDGTNWTAYTTPSYSCPAYSAGVTQAFLASAGNVANSSLTVQMTYWAATDQQNNTAPDLTAFLLQGQNPPTVQWCDTDNGVLSCVSNGGTT